MKLNLARLGLAAALLLAGCGAQPTALQGVAVAPSQAGAAGVIKNPTVLQKHIMFFDQNNDGLLTVEETKQGLARLGLSPLTSLGGAVFIHAGLQKASAGGLNLDIAKIQMTKHKSDSGAFDEEGRFVPAAFERIFSFDANHSGSLSWGELKTMIAANKKDTAGSLASKAEFGLLIKLAADTTEAEGKARVPALSRARLQAVYTGAIFYDVAAEREHKGARAIEGELPE